MQVHVAQGSLEPMLIPLLGTIPLDEVRQVSPVVRRHDQRQTRKQRALIVFVLPFANHHKTNRPQPTLQLISEVRGLFRGVHTAIGDRLRNAASLLRQLVTDNDPSQNTGRSPYASSCASSTLGTTCCTST